MTVPSALSQGGSAVAARGWVPSRYGGSLSSRHIAAVARTALSARGFRPDLATLGRTVAAEVLRRDELVGDVLPARWPELAEAWRQTTGPVTERLPAMLAIGERHARLLHRIAGGTDDHTATEVGLLGGLFNATIATIDTVGDAGDRRLLAALTPRALRSLLGGGDGRTATLEIFRRRTYDHPSGRTAVELMGAWTALAGRVLGCSGNGPAWARLRGTLHALLEAQRVVTGAGGTGAGAGGTGWDVPGLLAATRRKSAGPSTAIAQMVALARRPGDPPPKVLHRAAMRLGLVFCLADDLADLLDDARAGRPNLHLMRAWPDGGWLSDPAVYATVDRAGAELADLVRPTGSVEDGFAAEVLSRWLRWDDEERRAAPPVGLPDADRRATAAAVIRVLGDRAGGYPGARHVLTLPRGRVGAERTETHADLVFARAVALDALVDAYDAGLPVPYPVLCAEAVELLRAKHPDVRGGWNYLRSLPELPPDTDDLAQVLRALARLGGRPLAAACDEAVRVAVDGGDGGGIPTWILDRRRGGARDAEMARYVEVIGGTGVHPEVVANLLGALLCTDPVRYGRVVATGARYLAGTQQEDGSWTSAWYSGPFYGTFRAAEVLAAVPGWSGPCGRARNFLLTRQHPDGSWDGGDRASLSTAFAVLGLCALDPSGCRDAIGAGAGWLRSGQRDDGGWPAGPWIEFPTRDGRVSYRSRTATAAFCLQALLAAARAGGTPAPPP